MRIGIIAPPWLPVPPTRYGGTESVIDGLARGFQQSGHEVLLWTTGDSTCAVPRAHLLDMAQTERIGSAAVELGHVVRGYEALREWGADIIHDHTLAGPVYALRYPQLPVVTTNHGPFDGELGDLYGAVAEQIPIIAISHDQAGRASGMPLAGVIHHGLDLSTYPLGDGKGDEQGNYFLFLGRMVPEKGARRAALAAREAGVRLLMAAKMHDPLEHAFFQEQIRPLLDDRIRYVGEATLSEKVRLLKGAAGLVNPIRWPEPFGLVMIEALACGAPVLAFREGSAPEIVDHGVTGFLSDDLDELVASMAKAGDLDRRACRAAVEERFSTERMVRDHIALFERLVADWPKPRL